MIIYRLLDATFYDRIYTRSQFINHFLGYGAFKLSKIQVYILLLKTLIMYLLITKTCLYNFDPLKPYLYIVKLGFAGVYFIFLISAQKHILWVHVEAVLTRTHNLCFEQKYEKY